MATATTPDYQAGLAELRTGLTQGLPADALATFDADAAQLQQTHTDILKLKKGDKAPDFTLPDANGKSVSLSSLLRDGRVVLTFYRGAWCPYCNLQLNQLQQVRSEMADKGAKLVAVSPQSPDASADMQQKNELDFSVLSDTGNMVAKQFTTVFRNGDAPVDTMTALGFDFDGFYEDDARELPVPATFVIEQDRTVSFAKTAGGDYRNRVEPGEVLAAL